MEFKGAVSRRRRRLPTGLHTDKEERRLLHKFWKSPRQRPGRLTRAANSNSDEGEGATVLDLSRRKISSKEVSHQRDLLPFHADVWAQVERDR